MQPVEATASAIICQSKKLKQPSFNCHVSTRFRESTMPFADLLCHENLDDASVDIRTPICTFVFRQFGPPTLVPFNQLCDERDAVEALLIMKKEKPKMVYPDADPALRKSLDNLVEFYDVLCNNQRDNERQALIKAMYDIVIQQVCIEIEKDTAQALFSLHLIITLQADPLQTTLNHLVRIYNTLHDHQRHDFVSSIKGATDKIRDDYFGPDFFTLPPSF